MKINTCQPVRDLKGDPIKDDREEQITFGDIFATALLHPKEPLQKPESLRRFKLASRLFPNKLEGVEISVEEAALLQQLVNDRFPPLYVGRVEELIEGAANAGSKEN